MLKRSFRISVVAALCMAAAGLSAQTFDEGWGGIAPSVQPGTVPEPSAPGVVGAPGVGIGAAPAPAPAPAPGAGQPGIVQQLQGAWFGQNGDKKMLLIFQGSNCGLALNQMQTYGVWSVQGNRINMSFQNGKQTSFQFVLNGNSLILDGTVYLTRQQMPQQGAGVPGGGPGVATPAPAPQPVPQPGYAPATMLEGSWVTNLPAGQGVMTFRGNQYNFTLNGQMIEAGTFSLGPGVLNYTVTMGQSMGMSGQNSIVVQGSQFVMTNPSGQSMVFTRSGAQSGPVGQPAPVGMATPLEGRWALAANSRNRYLIAVYRGNMCYSYYNGSLLETSRFEYANGRIVYHMLTGSAAGATITMNCTVSGNQMLTEIPGRPPVLWVRQ